MYTVMIRFFAIIGAMVMGFMAMALIVGLILCAREFFYDLSVKNSYKHRFSKKPVAKCYCLDCKYYSRESHLCSKSGIRLSSDNFCKEAEPNQYNRYAPAPKQPEVDIKEASTTCDKEIT